MRGDDARAPACSLLGLEICGFRSPKPQFETPSTDLPPSPCSAFGSGSFLPAPEPTLAHFHTASHVAWSLTKLNFNYFFFFLFLSRREQQRSAGSSCLASCSRDRSVGFFWWGRGAVRWRARAWDGQAEGHRNRLLAESLTQRRGLLAFSFHPSSAPHCPSLGNATRDLSHHTCVSRAGWEHLGPLFCR